MARLELVIVQEEGGLIEPVGLLDWLRSDAPFWGFRVGRVRLIHDQVLLEHGQGPWRCSVAAPAFDWCAPCRP
jgi:hypothetical protein